MGVDPAAVYSERVVVVAPTQRDGEFTRKILGLAGIECRVEPDLVVVAALVAQGIGVLMLTDFALASTEMPRLASALEAQPSWSNLPVLALCREGSQPPVVERALQSLANVTVLDRPTSARVLGSAVRSCLRGRRWQYQIRDQIEALQQAENALRSADRRKDEFLATLAHELRNPLAPIRNGLHLLRHVQSGTEQYDKLRTMMERQLAQLVKLIDELLEVSRIATGKIILQRERLDVRDVVRTAVESCEPLFQAAQHTLTLKLPSRALWVVGDPARLAQAVSNLLNNAAKYTPNGGRVEVVVARVPGEVVVSVHDNGLGIPAAMLGRVFEMFAQVNQTLDRAQGGLGIGLSLVHSLVALHGGRVSARSAGPGQGSCFTLRLPIAAGGEATRRPAEAAGGAEARAAQRRLRVLVVDDNVDAADSLAILLQASGHDARVAYGGQQGLQIAQAFQPEAIFCDLGMPGIGGFELASRLRQDARFDDTALIAVTGWGTEDDKRRTQRAGFDFHLTKPAGPDNLQAILAEL